MLDATGFHLITMLDATGKEGNCNEAQFGIWSWSMIKECPSQEELSND